MRSALYLAKKSYMPRDQDFYHCAWSKGYKIFFSLCELGGLEPVYWGRDEVFSRKYDIVFIDRADGLKIFNQNRNKIKHRKSFYWCETTDNSKGVDLVGFISSEYMKLSKKKNIFWCGNIANGEKICYARNANNFSMLFLGRITKIIANKIRLIGKTHPDLVIYLMPITVPSKLNKNGKQKPFIGNNFDEFQMLQDYFNLDNLVVLSPQPHSKLNQYLETLAPTFGYVPSIYNLNYNRMQLPSSSKIFDYYASGIKCITEWNIPERNFPFNNIYKNKVLLNNEKYCKETIVRHANLNFYSDSRAKDILSRI